MDDTRANDMPRGTDNSSGSVTGPLSGSTPLVSVVIPAYNRDGYVAAAINSALSQSYPHLEVVVVDDGSTDSTSAVIAGLVTSDPRVREVRLPVNHGAQAARNAGIAVTQGDWITFLDSDDRFLPDSIEVRLQAAMKSGKRVVHSDALRLGPDGARVPYGTPALQGNVRRQLLTTPGTLFPSLMVRRDVLREIGGLDESIVAWQEWETSIRLSRNAEFAFVAQPTFEYDTATPGAISRDARRAADGYEQIVRKHRRLILREVGVKVLAAHYLTIAQERLASRDLSGAFHCGVVACVLWPPNVLRAARGLVRLVR